MNRIAFVGTDRQIHVIDGDGAPARRLTAPLARGVEGWSRYSHATEAWSWPSWSADGRWIGAFSVEPSDNGGAPSKVRALALDGVHEAEWASASGMAPIYLQWHPSGQAQAVLLQQGEDLVLGVLRADRLGQLKVIENGVPLFFNWTPGGERLLVHSGTRGGEDSRLVLRDPLGGGEDVPLPVTPGSFCAPVFAGERAVYVVREPGDPLSTVVTSAPDGTGSRSLLARRGLVAVVAAPQGLPFVAVSHAPRGEGTPYKGVDRIDLDTGEVVRLVDEDVLAFFWTPDGQRLTTAAVDSVNNCLRWQVVDAETGVSRTLGSFWPTRDLLFFLHFFEQYAGSHSLVSPDGTRLVYAGYPAGGGQADLSAPPRIYVKDLEDPEAPPVEAGRGTFAVYSPEE